MKAVHRKPQLYQRGELVMVIDCSDLDRSTNFWAEVLGYARLGSPVGPYQGLIPTDGHGVEVLLQRVPDEKRDKNRLHLDLRTPDLDAEVLRICGLGAVRITDQPLQEYGRLWHVLADPDGNEFCVARPPDSHQSAH